MYPRMKVELVITNRLIDLIAEGIDVAIRAGGLKDSGLVAKRYGLGYFGLWASPEYLNEHGTPRHPKELTAHKFLPFSRFNGGVRLTNGKESVDVAPDGLLKADDFETLRGLAALGDGIACLPSFLCGGKEKEKKLIRVLPQWHGEQVSLSLVYPAQKFVPAKVRAFIAVADEILKRN